ncbi:MAG TPA: CYCXC family (seleno)protein [Gemmatimonadales bacterium]|nr:CYCXC family (seleno)protein [Gemmatimonadales bacterium]
MKSVPWLVAGAAVLATVIVLALGRRGPGAVHPDPRPDITAERVLPPALLPDGPGVIEAYAAARNAPQLLDGVFCHCHCARTFGHRSLLTCFESDHGARCDICMGEARLATTLAARGRSLDEIRRAIDERFGS